MVIQRQGYSAQVHPLKISQALKLKESTTTCGLKTYRQMQVDPTLLLTVNHRKESINGGHSAYASSKTTSCS